MTDLVEAQPQAALTYVPPPPLGDLEVIVPPHGVLTFLGFVDTPSPAPSLDFSQAPDSQYEPLV